MELREYLQIIRKRIWVIVLITVISTVVSAAVSFFVLDPIYQSDTSLYVGKKVDTQATLMYNDVLLNTQLVKDYRELVKSRMVANTVIAELGLEGMTPKQLADKLGVNLKNDTRLISITAQDEDPKLARDIANKVAEVFQKKVVEIMDVENVQVIDEAITPINPVKPNKKINVAVAFLLGLMVGFALVLLIEYLDNTVKTPDDVEKHLELPVIGTIPILPEKHEIGEKALVTHINPKSPISEAYRVLRTNIQFSSVDKPLKSMVVTSAGPGEGKTTTIANIAVTFAQSGSKVLLIDADLRMPKVHRTFGVFNQDGLTNILVQRNSYKVYVQQTEVSNLEIITSGPIPPNPSELLASNAMKQFLSEVREDYDIILVDAPPVGTVTDAAILSTIVDGTILVVASAKVEIGAVQRGKELLEKVNANIIGVTLNKLDKKEQGNYYYYYYYYYGEDDAAKSKKHRKIPQHNN